MNNTDIDIVVDQILAGHVDAYEAIVREYQQDAWKVVAAMLLTPQRTEEPSSSQTCEPLITAVAFIACLFHR
jgi:hypothetical protein